MKCQNSIFSKIRTRLNRKALSRFGFGPVFARCAVLLACVPAGVFHADAREPTVGEEAGEAAADVLVSEFEVGGTMGGKLSVYRSARGPCGWDDPPAGESVACRGLYNEHTIFAYFQWTTVPRGTVATQTNVLNYTPMDVTATAGRDYTASSGSLTIPIGGSESGNAYIWFIDDATDEPDETMAFEIEKDVGNVQAQDWVAFQIRDNDPEPSLSIGDDSAAEDGGPLAFEVSLGAASGKRVTVDYAMADGTAVAPADYASTAGTLTFAPGTRRATISVALVDDGVAELDEDMTVTLSNAVNARIRDRRGAGLILDTSGMPGVSIADARGVEDTVGDLAFRVTLSEASADEVTVAYATMDGTATAGSDYTATSGTLTFAIGATELTIGVPVLADTVSEANEDFSVTLGSAVNGFIVDGTATGTIEDDEPGLVIADGEASEGDGSLPLVVSVSGVRGSRVLTVDYVTVDGTARAGEDFTGSSGSLTFAVGATAATIDVPLTDDSADEESETFTVELSNPVNAAVTDTTATATIRDDDDEPRMTVADAAGAEGSTAAFEVALDAASGRTVEVYYHTTSKTARVSVDFEAASGTLTFAPGTTRATIAVKLAEDALDEDDETFILKMNSAVAAVIDKGTATGTIRDIDPEPEVSVADARGTEGDDADFVVELSPASGRDVAVDYASSNGTAVAGADFVAVAGTLTIPAGATGATVSVSLEDDVEDEEEETFVLELPSASNATILDGSATGTIEDNDDPPTLTVSAAAADEGDDVVFVVALEGDTALTVTVAYATVSGTAQESQDFDAASGTLTFAPGDRTRTVSVSTRPDDLDEVDETFSFDLSSPTRATLGAAAAANGTIRDDDDAPTLAVTDADGDEGDAAAFEVALSAPSGLEVTVAYDAADGTATVGEDFDATAGTLTFAPGAMVLMVEVPLTDDDLDETDETFELRLASPVHATFGDRVGAGRIRDNDDPPELSIATATAEEGETAGFAVTLTAASGLRVTVSYGTADGTATAPDDFTSTKGVLTFAPGAVDRTIPVPIADDALDEPDETFELALSAPVNATIRTAAATGTIADNDDPPAIAVAEAFAEEGAAVAFRVELTEASSRQVRVSYATSDGSAEAGSDYTRAAGDLTLAPGATVGTVFVGGLEDDLDEPEETFTLTLSGPVNARLQQGAGSAQGRIIDDDGAPQIAIRNATGTEGGRAEFEVTMAGSTSQAVTVDYATRDLSAREGEDYEAATGTLTFAAGTGGAATIPITLTDDAVAEPDEMFEVVLSSPANATLATGVAAGTIRDNDPPPTLSVSDATGEEGRDAVFTVSLSGPTALAVTVRYATLADSAEAGSDYRDATGSLDFAPGETTATVAVALVDDAEDEPEETFFLQIRSPVNATLVAGTGTGTIRDNDAAPALSVGGAAVAEGGTLEFEVVLAGATNRTVAVDYRTSAGTARADTDYEPTMGSLRFAPGTSRRTVSVHTHDDDIHESVETVQLGLSAPVNATLASATGVGRILDDDGEPTLAVAGADGAEGEIVRFRVTLAGATGQAVTVDYATAEGTASAGADYEAVSGTLTFAPGQSGREIAVRLLQDVLGEPDESFEVRLSSPVNAALTTSAATGTIRDDDGGIPRLSAEGAVVVEGGVLVFALSLDRPAGSAVEVDYRAENRTALAGTDYTPAAGTLTLDVGETTGAVEVRTIDDDERELEERLALRLASSVNASVASNVVIGTILDNDVPPELSVEGGVSVEGEDAVFVVALIGAVNRQVTVDYATMTGTALAGEDFVRGGRDTHVQHRYRGRRRRADRGRRHRRAGGDPGALADRARERGTGHCLGGLDDRGQRRASGAFHRGRRRGRGRHRRLPGNPRPRERIRDRGLLRHVRRHGGGGGGLRGEAGRGAARARRHRGIRLGPAAPGRCGRTR